MNTDKDKEQEQEAQEESMESVLQRIEAIKDAQEKGLVQG
jgi:hypothetical protein